MCRDEKGERPSIVLGKRDLKHLLVALSEVRRDPLAQVVGELVEVALVRLGRSAHRHAYTRVHART